MKVDGSAKRRMMKMEVDEWTRRLRSRGGKKTGRKKVWSGEVVKRGGGWRRLNTCPGGPCRS
jgi:hypothetical protein